jgi:Domain of unknown function (DUF5979)
VRGVRAVVAGVAVLSLSVATLASVPLVASASSSISVSDEVAGGTIAARAATQALRTPWEDQVLASHPGAVFETSTIPLAASPFPTTPFYTASDGTSVAVETRVFTAATIADATNLGTLAAAPSQGSTSCSNGGLDGQNGSPRPTSLASTSTASPPSTRCALSGGFAFTQTPSGLTAGQRSGLVFTFSKPTAAFGAWFGDVETKSPPGVRAIVRTYNTAGGLIAQSSIGPGSTNESSCGTGTNGNNTAALCGNATTRWIGFSNSGTDLVSTMIVIVGDDDTGTTGGVQADGRDEGLGFVGATIATFPEVGVAKRVVPGWPKSLGTGDWQVAYDIRVSNSGGSALTKLSLIDDLAKTFRDVAIVDSITDLTTEIVTPPSLGSRVALNPKPYTGVSNPELLDASASGLAPTESVTIRLIFTITPGDSTGPFDNVATASATDGRSGVSDASTDSTDLVADADGDGSPANDSTSTPISFAIAPSVGLAKYVSSLVDNRDGSWNVTYRVLVRGGETELRKLRITDDIDTTFTSQQTAVSEPKIIDGPFDKSSIVNANSTFDGRGDPVVASAEWLAAGDEFTVEFTVVVQPKSEGPYLNEARVDAFGPKDAVVSDASTDGRSPDPEGDGAADNREPTPVSFAPSGAIEITKIIEGGPRGGVSGDFAFAIDCGKQGVFDLVVTLRDEARGAATLYGVPAGATCVITETGVPVAPAQWAWARPEGAPTDVRVENQVTSAVTVVNPLTSTLGAIVVTKSVVGAPAGGVSGTFAFTADCGPSGTFATEVVLAAAVSGSATIGGIPAPADCVVTESSVPAAPTFSTWTTGAGQSTDVRVEQNSSASATITNTLRALRGSVTVTKVVVGAPAGGVTGAFGFGVDCGPAGAFSTTVTLTGATTGSATIAGIPAPATCVVTESSVPIAPTFFAWATEAGATATAAISDGATSTVSITNVLRPVSGGLTIATHIAGGPSGGIDGVFEFDVDCGAAGTYTRSIAVSSSTTGAATISGVPAPASCTVFARGLPVAPQFYAWAATTSTVGPIAISDGVTASADFTHTLRPVRGAVAVTQTIDGAPVEGITGTFEFVLDCGDSGSFASTVFLNAATRGERTVADIGAPAHCTVTPGTPPTAPAGYEWSDDVTVTPARVSIVDGVTTAVEIARRLVRQTGAVSFTITLVGAPDQGVTGRFSYVLECGASGTFPVAVDFVGATRSTTTVTGIPAPATCVLDEVSRPASPNGFQWVEAALPTLSVAVGSTTAALSAESALAAEGDGVDDVGADGLANTGADAAIGSLWALGLLLAGGMLMVAARVRRRRG